MNNQSEVINIGEDRVFDVIKSATDKAVNFVKPTYGPSSKKVIISKFTHGGVYDDGVQVMRDLELPIPEENAILKVIKETAIKTSDRVGDGTTGAMIILQGIIDEVAQKANRNTREIELELAEGLKEFKAKIGKLAKKITTKEELIKVARVSFDDPVVAEMIADLYKKLGKDATITVEKSPTLDTYAETSEGIKIDKGYISPYMVNNLNKMETVYEKPLFLITDYRITENTDIMPIINKLAEAHKSKLVIIAEGVEQDALATLNANQPTVFNVQLNGPGRFPSVAISLPGDGEDKHIILEDIATLVGAKVFSNAKGDKLEEATIEDLGRAHKFICRRDESIIIEPKGDRITIDSKIKSFEANIKRVKEEFKRKGFEQRLAFFKNSIATIKVGAPTENEQKALQRKVENAVNATKSAYNHGVVAGGGFTLGRTKTSSPILNRALQKPTKQLLANMGNDVFEVDSLGKNEAFNVVIGSIGDFMDVGVVDPAEVLIAGVESAVSIATILISSCGIIVECPVKDKV